MSLPTDYFVNNGLYPSVQDRVDEYREYLDSLPSDQSKAKLTLLHDARYDADLSHAYTRFPLTQYPYVVRFVQQALKGMHPALPVAEMITERHIEAYLAIDIAFSGTTMEMVWDRHTREGSSFETEVFEFLFENNLHQTEKVAMLIQRRAVRSIADIKEALKGAEGIHTALIEGVL